MPWKGKTVAQTRREFVERVLNHEKTKAALCREYGISRPTGDKWLKRWREGEAELDDRSHQAFHVRNRLDPGVEGVIVEYRRKFPSIGARKIHFLLKKAGDIAVPSVSTVNSVLKRNGLIAPEASLAATPHVRFAKDEPNDMWQADFKGWFRIGGDVQCHVLNILDDHSRFCIRSVPLPGETLELTLPVFLDAFEEYGLPISILCDNGNPWGTPTRQGFSRFEVAMMELGVLVLHGRVHHPQTQGKMERFNRTETEECFSIPHYDFSQYSFDQVKYHIDGFLSFYNYDRPHESLAMDAPRDHYRPSPRKFDRFRPFVPEWDYPAGYSTRTVKHKGFFLYRGREIFVSEALEGKRIALRESRKPGCITLFFREFRLGRYNLAERLYESRSIRLVEGDPRDWAQSIPE